MTKEAKAFIMGLLSASVIMSASNKIPNKNVDKENTDSEIVTSETIPNKTEVDESLLISIKDHLNDLLALENSLYDYKQYLVRYYYVEYKDGKNIEHNWLRYENEIPTEEEIKYYGYKEVLDENGNKTKVKDKESDSLDELVNDGYTYIRSNLKAKYRGQETIVSHLFIGYKKIVCANGEIVIVKSEPTFSIESLLSQGYDYVKKGEIYYSFDTSNGKFIEYQDIPGPSMVKQKTIILL